MPENTEFVLKDDTVSIASYAFYNCTGLTSINIPESVISMGDGTFSNCSNLTSINISQSVTSIEYGVFSGCTDLKSITIPDSITSIKDYAFSGCIGLKSIIISDSVKSIGSYAFERCNNLTEIKIPESITSIEWYALNDTAWYNNQPDGLVYAGKIAYKYKGEMPENTEIVLKDDTVSISYAAFWDCSCLKSITIPDSVTSIKNNAFYNCTGLTSINIPDSVTEIGDSAFSSCSDLTSITIKNPNCQIDDYIDIPDTATIYGYNNSTAQAYAEKYDIKFVELDDKPADTVKGDVTGDGTVDIADVVAAASYVGDNTQNKLSNDAIIAGDVHNTGDGLTGNDVLMIQQYLAKIITEL